MIDLNKLTKEQLETLVEWGMGQEIALQAYEEETPVCREGLCIRTKGHKGCHISVCTFPRKVRNIWNTPSPVGVPRGLAISIAQALLTAAESMPEDGEIVCDNFCDFAARVLSHHPEWTVAFFHAGEMDNIERGDYGAH